MSAAPFRSRAERLELSAAAMRAARARTPRRVRTVPTMAPAGAHGLPLETPGVRVERMRLETWGPFSGARYAWHPVTFLPTESETDR